MSPNACSGCLRSIQKVGLPPLLDLEIQPQGKLNLPAGAQSNVANYGLPKQSDSSAGSRLGISLTRLYHVAGAHGVEPATLRERRQGQVQA